MRPGKRSLREHARSMLPRAGAGRGMAQMAAAVGRKWQESIFSGGEIKATS